MQFASLRLCHVNAEKRVRGDRSGAVNDAVDPAETRAGLVKHGSHLLLIASVGAANQHLGAEDFERLQLANPPAFAVILAVAAQPIRPIRLGHKAGTAYEH